jgi:outer membrane lipoprotein-sorting protein
MSSGLRGAGRAFKGTGTGTRTREAHPWLRTCSPARGRAWALALCAVLLGAGSLGSVQAASEGLTLDAPALAAVERFESTWRAAKSATYRIIKTERLRKGKTVVEELAIKLKKPGHVYVKMVRPIAKREILYDRTKNPRRLTVHNGQFPDLTLNLDVRGMLAMHDQHHSIEALGFDQAVQVFRDALAAARKAPHGEWLQYAGERTFAGRKVDYVIMNSGKRPARREEALEDESLFDFAERVGMDAYVIYQANPQIRSITSELDGGESYVVPAYYAQRCDSWFDKETGMPLKQAMFDAKGTLYESYEHYDIKLDAPLTDADFDQKNPAYGF